MKVSGLCLLLVGSRSCQAFNNNRVVPVLSLQTRLLGKPSLQSVQIKTSTGDGGQLPPAVPPDMWNRGSGGDGDDHDNYNHHGLIPMLIASMVWSSAMAGYKQVAWAGDPTTVDPMENVSRGTSSLLKTSKNFWSEALESLSQRLSNIFKPKAPTEDELEMEKLRSTVVSKVIIRNVNGTVVPQSVLDTCAARAGLLGGVLTPGPVQDMARLLKQYYQRQGYVLSSMTGATLVLDDANEGVVEISVEEPLMSSDEPVAIAFAKKQVVHPQTGQPMSLSDYKKNLTRSQLQNFNPNKLNTTYVQTQGKTRASVVAKALGLAASEPFRWSETDWTSIQRSPVFQEVLQAEPVRLEDGSIQFRIICRERPVRNLEYGVSKSLFSNKWEGELGLEHGNLLGGGETLEVSLKRAARDSEASYRISYKDQDFCTPTNGKRGWAFEAFNEYIGTSKSSKRSLLSLGGGEELENTIQDEPVQVSKPEEPQVIPDEPTDASSSEPSIRKGLSFSISHPLSNYIQRSHVQLSAEHVLSESGASNNILSSVLSVGPFVKSLPRGGRHSVNVAVGVGSRIAASKSLYASSPTLAAAAFVPAGGAGAEETNMFSKLADTTIPYGHVTATTRQVFPLGSTGSSLALRHSVSTCTSSIPHHTAVANSASVRVRGYGSGPTAFQGSVLGTTEVRVPLPLPAQLKDVSLVVFGDWLFAQTLTQQRGVCRQSSVGVGLRKTIQGIPLRYDVSLTEEGKVGAMFNFGKEFDVY